MNDSQAFEHGENRQSIHMELPKTPKVSIPLLFFLILSSVCGSLLLPLLSVDSPYLGILSWIVCAASVITILLTVRRPMLVALTLITMFSLFSLTGSSVFSALLFGSFLTVSAASVLFCTASRAKLAIVILTIPATCGIAYAITSNPISAALALALYLPALALGITKRCKADKTVCIATATATVVIPALGVVTLFVFLLYGSLNAESIKAAADALCDTYTTLMVKAYETVGQEVSASALRAFRDEADLLINSSLGLLTALAMTVSLIAYNTQKRILTTLGFERARKEKLSVSLECAVIYIVAFILSYTTGASGGVSLVSVVGTNLCLMLMLLFVVLGFDAMQHLVEKLRFAGVLVAAGLMLSTFFLSSLASTSVLCLLALIGAFYVVIVNIGQRATDYFGKGETNE